MLAQYMLSSCVRLSICPSVTSQYCTKMAKHRIMQKCHTNSPGTLFVFRSQKSPRNSNEVTPKVGYKQRWVG